MSADPPSGMDCELPPRVRVKSGLAMISVIETVCVIDPTVPVTFTV